MRSNLVYGINQPKQMLGTDKNLAFLLLLASVMVTWVTFSWKMGVGAFAVSYVVIKFAQQKSKKDPWWFRLYRPYNRYADMYVPWPVKSLGDRFSRPYGFGRDSKL